MPVVALVFLGTYCLRCQSAKVCAQDQEAGCELSTQSWKSSFSIPKKQRCKNSRSKIPRAAKRTTSCCSIKTSREINRRPSPTVSWSYDTNFCSIQSYKWTRSVSHMPASLLLVCAESITIVASSVLVVFFLGVFVAMGLLYCVVKPIITTTPNNNTSKTLCLEKHQQNSV